MMFDFLLFFQIMLILDKHVQQDANDPLKNDEIEKVADETMQGLKELGAFGLQVSNFSFCVPFYDNLRPVLKYLFFTI